MPTSITHHFHPNARGSISYPVGHSRWAVLATSISLLLPSYQTTITSTTGESNQPISSSRRQTYALYHIPPACLLDSTLTSILLPHSRFNHFRGGNLSRTKVKFSFCAKPWGGEQKGPRGEKVRHLIGRLQRCLAIQPQNRQRRH